MDSNAVERRQSNRSNFPGPDSQGRVTCAKIFLMPRQLDRIGLVLLSVCLVLFPLVFQTASAQEGGVARLAPIETAAFPLLTTYLDVRDATGSFVYGLEADADK